MAIPNVSLHRYCNIWYVTLLYICHTDTMCQCVHIFMLHICYLCYTYAIYVYTICHALHIPSVTHIPLGFTNSKFFSGVDHACCKVPLKRETPPQRSVERPTSPRWETSQQRSQLNDQWKRERLPQPFVRLKCETKQRKSDCCAAGGRIWKCHQPTNWQRRGR